MFEGNKEDKMKDFIHWLRNLFAKRNEVKNDDSRKERLFRVLWRTKNTGWYANDTRVWAACEEDIPDILRKFFKMGKNEKFTELRVLQEIHPL